MRQGLPRYEGSSTRARVREGSSLVWSGSVRVFPCAPEIRDVEGFDGVGKVGDIVAKLA